SVPKAPLVELYNSSPLPIVLIEAVADPSFAERRARKRLGIAIAAKMRIIATTISKLINEKPFFFFFSFFIILSPFLGVWNLATERPYWIGALVESAAPVRLNRMTADSSP